MPKPPLGKMLLLSKRHSMSRDILLEECGRHYEFARFLAAAGWKIKGYCLNYRERWKKEVLVSGDVAWFSYAAPARWYEWRRDVRRAVRMWKPDIVLGCSDPIHIALASEARNPDAGLVVDLHDNLESQGMIRLPGLQGKVAAAINGADLVSCVSEPLAAKVKADHSPHGRMLVLENAVPKEFSRGRVDIASARRRYDLPLDSRVIGVAGSLYRRRGIETVLDAFRLLRGRDPEVILALAGPTDLDPDQLREGGVRYFGNLDYELMPTFLSSMDVGVVQNIRPSFADYCHPQKAVELCALSIPIVAARFGVMGRLARDVPEILYQPDDPGDLARAIDYQLTNGKVLKVPVKTWAEQADVLRQSLCEIMEPRR